MLQRDYPTSGRLGNSDDAGDDGVINIPAGSVPNQIASAPHPHQTQVQVFKVNGEERQFTSEQIQEYVQKAAAADEKFREAAKMRDEASRALAIQQDLAAIIKGGDVDAFRRMGAQMGVPGDEVEEEIRKIWGDGSDDDWDDDEDEEPDPRLYDKRNAAPPRPVKIGINELTPDVQRLVLAAEAQRIDGIVAKALDSNENVRYNMAELDENGREAVRSLVKEKIRGRLAATDGDFGDGSHILREVLPEVEHLLKALGSPRRNAGALGLGVSPGGGDGGVYPKKKPDHVPSTDGGWEQNIMETIGHHMRNASQTG